MTSIVVFGAGKIADVFHALVASDSGLSIAAFTCDSQYVTGPQFCGRPLVPFEEIEKAYPPADHSMFVAIGYQNLNAVRAERCRQARAKGYRLVSWVGPRGEVPNGCMVGENCFVMDRASLQPHARLGDDVFVWSGSIVGHHATIGDHCWLASNSTISSTAVVEPFCFLGVNAAVGHGITVGSRCLIGASAVLTRSAAPDGVYIVADTERYRLDSRRFMSIARMT